MRRELGTTSLALLFGCLLGLSGCSTIKWMYTDKTTGEMWWIKHSPLGSDEINYCAPQTGAPVQCGPADLLGSAPAAWAAAQRPAAQPTAASPTTSAPASFVVSYTPYTEKEWGGSADN